MGVGVAGLQAIATARRLGAIVSATDVRPATKEQVEILGATFVAVDRRRVRERADRRRLCQGDVGGVPGEAGRADRRAYQEAGHRHHHRADPRPRRRRCWSRDEMVETMKPGSVIVDLAVEQGGNCPLLQARPGRSRHNGVKIIGARQPARHARGDASPLYAAQPVQLRRRLFVDKKTRRALKLDWDDEIIKGARRHRRERRRSSIRRSTAEMRRQAMEAIDPFDLLACRFSCWRSSSAITWCGA